MLSAAKYPYMNRAQRRDPSTYEDAVIPALGCAVSRLMWALLVRAGVFIGTVRAVGNDLGLAAAISAGIRAVGESIASKARAVWRKLFG